MFLFHVRQKYKRTPTIQYHLALWRETLCTLPFMMMWLTMDLLVLWAMAQLCRSPFYLFRGNPQEIVSWKDLPNEMEAIKTTLDREWPGLRYFMGFSLFHSMPLFHPTSTTPEHSAWIYLSLCSLYQSFPIRRGELIIPWLISFKI